MNTIILFTATDYFLDLFLIVLGFFFGFFYSKFPRLAFYSVIVLFLVFLIFWFFTEPIETNNCCFSFQALRHVVEVSVSTSMGISIGRESKA